MFRIRCGSSSRFEASLTREEMIQHLASNSVGDERHSWVQDTRNFLQSILHGRALQAGCSLDTAAKEVERMRLYRADPSWCHVPTRLPTLQSMPLPATLAMFSQALLDSPPLWFHRPDMRAGAGIASSEAEENPPLSSCPKDMGPFQLKELRFLRFMSVPIASQPDLPCVLLCNTVRPVVRHHPPPVAAPEEPDDFIIPAWFCNEDEQ